MSGAVDPEVFRVFALGVAGVNFESGLLPNPLVGVLVLLPVGVVRPRLLAAVALLFAVTLLRTLALVLRRLRTLLLSVC